ncbi:MAG: DNA alkylation repair protein [bacterium]
MAETYELLREKLSESRDKSFAESQKRALSSQLSFLGTKKGVFNKVLAEFTEANRDAISLTPINPLLESLWNGNTYEERLLALRFLLAFKGLLGEREWGLLSKWADTAENWSLADWVAHVRAWLLRRYPERVTALINWCGSENIWVRRAAVVSLLIYDPEEKDRTQVAVPTRQALRVIEAAMFDTEPLVMKATTWVAREIGREAPELLARMLEQHRVKASKAFMMAAMEGLPERLRDELIAIMKAPPPPPTPQEMKKAAAKAAKEAREAKAAAKLVAAAAAEAAKAAAAAKAAKKDAAPPKPSRKTVAAAKPAAKKKGGAASRKARTAARAKPAAKRGKPAAAKSAKRGKPSKPAKKSPAKRKTAAASRAKKPRKKPSKKK